MKEPIYLREGDLIWITATARKISIESIQPAVELLKKWGLRVKIGNTIDLENDQYGGTDEERIKDFQEALDDPEVKAIWCAKGGYGTVRILDGLDFSGFIEHPKWIVGYSDITVLHSHINRLRVQSLHATMPIDVPNLKPKALRSLKRALFGKKLKYEVKNSKYNRIGKARGELVGGNLSVLYSLLGSPTSIDTKGKILFLEDLDEYLYHIDRMLMNLKRNGYFEELKGLVIGGMTDMHDNTIPFGKNAKEIILDIVSSYDFPVAFNFPSGHVKGNRALILGREAELDVNTSGTLLNLRI
ncbi:LD-carboxypeptidase [Leptobacterium flavescens]|uniref:LD-carboxypeptidase n=1 Tax=Leptobacterium flavescens TaxID=472055 RepID=A0A6P0UK62_9FLAO|nr:LD-carboxypeptidase [Leptobacterium flavescens]NER12942.1 LD-carboxypeptidase [Leptobacterium flavescens]